MIPLLQPAGLNKKNSSEGPKVVHSESDWLWAEVGIQKKKKKCLHYYVGNSELW